VSVNSTLLCVQSECRQYCACRVSVDSTVLCVQSKCRQYCTLCAEQVWTVLYSVCRASADSTVCVQSKCGQYCVCRVSVDSTVLCVQRKCGQYSVCRVSADTALLCVQSECRHCSVYRVQRLLHVQKVQICGHCSVYRAQTLSLQRLCCLHSLYSIHTMPLVQHTHQLNRQSATSMAPEALLVSSLCSCMPNLSASLSDISIYLMYSLLHASVLIIPLPMILQLSHQAQQAWSAKNRYHIIFFK
jgi:hypothetical protein